MRSTRFFRRRFFPAGLSIALVVLFVGSMLVVAPVREARAATITVDTTDDELNADGDCSLREAIQAANTNSAVDTCTAGTGADEIVLQAVGPYTLSLAGASEDSNATGDLDITAAEQLDITGNGATIDGAGIDRVLHITDPGATVTLNNVTIQNGQAPDGIGNNDDGESGGGIYNAGDLTLNNSTIQNNQSGAGGSGTSPANGGDGGGIFNATTGTVNVNNSSVSNNTAGAGGAITTGSGSGADGGNGGGIYNEGTLDIENGSQVNNNNAGAGGTTVNGTGGDAGGGGGIYNESGGTVNLSDTNVTGNNAGTGGAGATGTAANGGLGGSGGGIYTAGTLNIEDPASCLTTSIEGNAAGDGGTGGSGGGNGGPAGSGGGISIANTGSATIHNTFVRGNKAGDGGDGGGFSGSGNNGGNAGGVEAKGSLVMESVVVSGNVSGLGGLAGTFGTAGTPGNFGGMLVEAAATLTNLTVSGNESFATASGVGGVFIFGTSAAATVQNSIFWGNIGTQANVEDRQIFIGASSPGAALNYAIVEGAACPTNATCDANLLHTDPLFFTAVDTTTLPNTSGDLRVNSGSPALESGDNTVNTTTCDVRGRTRIEPFPATATPVTIDRGAFEIYGGPTAITLSTFTAQSGYNGVAALGVLVAGVLVLGTLLVGKVALRRRRG